MISHASPMSSNPSRKVSAPRGVIATMKYMLASGLLAAFHAVLMTRKYQREAGGGSKRAAAQQATAGVLPGAVVVRSALF